MREFDNNLRYEESAYIMMNQIMSNTHKNMIDNINRANKGELFILHFLTICEAPVFPSELSAALQASTARISALLGNLEKKGQIEREIDKNNRRNILVTITEAGRERADAEMQEMKNSMTRVFIEMGEADTAEFIRLTKQFFALSEKHMPNTEAKNG